MKEKKGHTQFIWVDIAVFGELGDVQAFISDVTKSFGDVCLYRNSDGCGSPALGKEFVLEKWHSARTREGRINIQRN